MNLTEKDVNEFSGEWQRIFPNRLTWVKYELKNAGLIKTDRRSSEITHEGLKVL